MMETDITLSYIKYLLDEEIIDIEYMKNIDKSKFIGSNIHKLVTSLCVNYVNIGSSIEDYNLSSKLDLARNYLVHSRDIKESKQIKFYILNILELINTLNGVETYNEYNYMIY